MAGQAGEQSGNHDSMPGGMNSCARPYAEGICTVTKSGMDPPSCPMLYMNINSTR